MDGFPFELFKFIWNDLKFCISDAINFSFDKGCLTLTLRQCIITCIPKKGKPRERIKNWRPLSVLSVLYKLVSAAIANRMKPCLDQIIDKIHCGFIPERYIGECTQLILDIMKITEDRCIPGMLILIDFEKAFDSASWSFIYQILAHLGFSEKFMNWIKLFNHNIKVTIIHCGVLSDFINIQRGADKETLLPPIYLLLLHKSILKIINLYKESKLVMPSLS